MATDDVSMSAADALDQLKAEMKTALDADLFFFPAQWGVNGFYGTGDMWFVAEKPSTGGFPSRHDRLLYDTLNANGFANAHLTDVSKETGPGDEDISPAERQRNVPYFERELKILQPTLLVALGEKAEQELNWMDATDDIETMRVNHYSWAGRWGKEETFERQIRKVADRLDELDS